MMPIELIITNKLTNKQSQFPTLSVVSARDGVNKPPYPLLVVRVSSRQCVAKRKSARLKRGQFYVWHTNKEILKELWSVVYVIVSLECTPDTLKRTLASLN
jgi:hypothetical protein